MNKQTRESSWVQEVTCLSMVNRVLEVNCHLIDSPRNPLTHVAKCNKKLFEKDLWNFRS